MILDPKMPPEAKELIRKEFGLDKPLMAQYLYYLKNTLTGNFGRSFYYPEPVLEIVKRKLPPTILLFTTAVILSYLIGLPLGKSIAWRRGSRFEMGATVFGLFFYTVFIPWFGLIAIWIFSYKLGWFPIGGMLTPEIWATDSGLLPKMGDIPFFGKQQLIALYNRGVIDPENIDEYIGRDGYTALARALTEMTPEGIIEEIKASGLRGRGGAGFPTGLKWSFCRKAPGGPKYVICNGDEGDPGAFMDRSVIEGNPHLVIEGMVIGAYCIGASIGYVYIRAEYPLAVERLRLALETARGENLLGQNIMGLGFDFDIKVKLGAGAFVCGEETALIASIEGERGMPRAKPPFPV
ncbi:hypothetical protein LCGC14_3072050, partial [marine sediment metagenome]